LEKFIDFLIEKQSQIVDIDVVLDQTHSIFLHPPLLMADQNFCTGSEV